MKKKYYFCSNRNCESYDLLVEDRSCSKCGMKLLPKNPDEKIIDTSKKFSVCFYLQEGVEVLDFAGPMEVFSLAGFNVFTVSKNGKSIVAQGILTVVPDYGISTAPDADMVAFFGGNSAAFLDNELVAWIKKYEAKSKFVFSVCSGAFALGHAGLLNGQTVTTFHSRIEELRTAFPDATVLNNIRFVDNGRIITTAGISAGIDGALHLVARIKGEAIARVVADEMEYDKWNANEGLVKYYKK